jgi:hypothetical protein
MLPIPSLSPVWMEMVRVSPREMAPVPTSRVSAGSSTSPEGSSTVKVAVWLSERPSGSVAVKVISSDTRAPGG